MPEIVNKTLHSFSSEDPQFPAANLLETKITKKWKCKEPGEKSCFVVLKLDEPRTISGIDIGNEKSGFIEVLVANSKKDPPEFKEILLATSFMTVIDAANAKNPNRVRFFDKNILIESVAKQKWDLVKILCTQPFMSRVQYGLSFVTLHTLEEIKDEKSPVKTSTVAQPSKSTESGEKKKFGKFSLRTSDSDSDDSRKKKDSAFSRWKSTKNEAPTKTGTYSIKEHLKAKLNSEQNRKRIRLMEDSSDEDEVKSKSKQKPDRNRTELLYDDEDEKPNDRLQKKLDRDQEAKEKEKKHSKSQLLRDASPKTEPNKSKFASFISDKQSSSRSPSSSKPSSSSSKSSSSKSPHKVKTPEKKSSQTSSAKKVSYKPFHKLLEGVGFAFSGYVNPERGILRQKALDMGAKYRPDWDSSCTHLICAFTNTPKYQQVRGKGKIVTKRWIEACFSEQKKLPWRRYALNRDDKDEVESEEEIHNLLSKAQAESPKKSGPKKITDPDSEDDDMVVIDKRVKSVDPPKEEKKEDKKPVEDIDEVMVVDKELEPEPTKEEPNNNKMPSHNAMEISTDDEQMSNGSIDLTQCENQIYKEKYFFLNEDLPATDIMKLKSQIPLMHGKLTEKPSKANFIITKSGQRIPQDSSAEVVKALWVYECYEIGALIPTKRYKIDSSC